MNLFTDRHEDRQVSVSVVPLMESALSAVRERRDRDALAILTTVVANLADGDLTLYRATHQLREELKARR